MSFDRGRWRLGLLALAGVAAFGGIDAGAVPIEWVTVGDAGNGPDTIRAIDDWGPYGAVDHDYRIMKYEWTNAQYVAYLNAVDPQGANPHGIYDTRMGSDPRGGISFAGGNPAGRRYAVRPHMADKPVTFVTWFQAARVANWLEAGARTYATSAAGAAIIDDGAYTLAGTGPGTVSKNSGARHWIPLENEWYKAAYYRGGGAYAGYRPSATSATGAAPALVGATDVGVGRASAGAAGHSANANRAADWNGLDGHVTSVGTNGGPSAYGAYDLGGNVWEWADKGPDVTQVIRGGSWDDAADLKWAGITAENQLTSGARIGNYRLGAFEASSTIGFRLAASPAAAVTETAPAAVGSIPAAPAPAAASVTSESASPVPDARSPDRTGSGGGGWSPPPSTGGRGRAEPRRRGRPRFFFQRHGFPSASQSIRPGDRRHDPHWALFSG